MPRRLPRRRTTSRRRPGRPTLLTPETQDAIITAVRAGATFTEAAARAGISPRTLQAWRQQGASENAPPELRDLAEQVHRAHHDARVRMSAIVMRAAAGGALVRRTTRQLRDGTTETEEVWSPADGRLALDWLSRVDPATWGRRAPLQVEVSGGDTPIVIEPSRMGALAQRLHEYSQRDNTMPRPEDSPTRGLPELE